MIARKPLLALEFEAISIMGTSLTFYRGRSYNERLCALVASETGLPVTSMSTSIIRALKANHVTKVTLATAYTQDLNDRLSDFLAEYDILTAGVAGLGLTDINAVRPTSPETGLPSRRSCVQAGYLGKRHSDLVWRPADAAIARHAGEPVQHSRYLEFTRRALGCGSIIRVRSPSFRLRSDV